MHSAESAGANADLAPEYISKVFQVPMAQVHPYVTNAHIGISQQLLRTLDPTVRNILVGTHTCGILEESREVVRAHINFFSKGGNLEVFIEIGLDVIHDPLQA